MRVMTKGAISGELFREVEALLYAEARMLEENRFDDWLACLTDDIRYWMPVQESLDFSAKQAAVVEGFALYDDDKKSLELRVLRIQTGEAHAEVPPSSTLRLLSNIIVEPASTAESYNVHSSFMVYQERRGQHGVNFYGRRSDVLRRVRGELKLASRKIELAQAILPTAISIFF
jgi:3-phenylpropionate/cinnamic acid dioxygenase small subunit